MTTIDINSYQFIEIDWSVLAVAYFINQDSNPVVKRGNLKLEIKDADSQWLKKKLRRLKL